MEDYDKKIDGFDRWELNQCLDALTKVADLKKDKKKLKAVNKLAAMQLKEAQEKANQANLETKVDKKLKEVYDGKK